MNAFESLISDCLQADGYWTSTEFKVNLTKEEKRAIQKPSAPRWELDVVGFAPVRNEVIVVECKSFLDSTGVSPASFDPTHKSANRYKLFTNSLLWPVISNRLISQLTEAQLVRSGAKVRLGLAYGNSKKSDELGELFRSRGWQLFGPDWICEHIDRVAKAGWQNSTTSIVAKLLARR